MDRRIFGVFFLLLLVTGGFYLYQVIFDDPTCEDEDFQSYFLSIDQGVSDTLIVGVDTVRMFGQVPGGRWMVNNNGWPKDYFAFSDSGKYLAEFFLEGQEQPCKQVEILVKKLPPPKPPVEVSLYADLDTVTKKNQEVVFTSEIRNADSAEVSWRLNGKPIESQRIEGDTVIRLADWRETENIVGVWVTVGKNTMKDSILVVFDPPKPVRRQVDPGPVSRVPVTPTPPNSGRISTALNKMAAALANDNYPDAESQLRAIERELTQRDTDKVVTVNGVTCSLSTMMVRMRAKTQPGVPVSVSSSVAMIRGTYRLAVNF